MRNDKIDLRGTLHATDWLKGISYDPEGKTEIVQVLFKNTRAAFYRNPERIPLKKGDWVAVEASPGHDIGQVMLTGPLVNLQMKKANVSHDSDIKRIFRKASEADIEKFEEARAREHTTMIRSRQIAAELGLNMKIGDVEYQGDGAKAIFYYIADERVDFRKLIRILADTFKIRIEMKQIGARQEAGRIGGIGPCGRPLCCSSWMSRFVSVGTGAARIQDLSMNPQKLAGQCGKLKCCLNFETDAYAEAARQMPPKDAILQTRDADYFQFKVDILARTITYSTDKHLAVNLVTITAARAFEIIELNKNGVKVEQLDVEKAKEEPKKEYVEIVGQDSLTRFDKSGKNRKNRKKAKGSEGNRQSEQKPQQRQQDPKSPQKQQEQHKGQKTQKQKAQKPQQTGGQKPQPGGQKSHQSAGQKPQQAGGQKQPKPHNNAPAKAKEQRKQGGAPGSANPKIPQPKPNPPKQEA